MDPGRKGLKLSLVTKKKGEDATGTGASSAGATEAGAAGPPAPGGAQRAQRGEAGEGEAAFGGLTTGAVVYGSVTGLQTRQAEGAAELQYIEVAVACTADGDAVAGVCGGGGWGDAGTGGGGGRGHTRLVQSSKATEQAQLHSIPMHSMRSMRSHE